MAIATYFHPEKMTPEQYDQIMAKLETVGQGSPKGRVHHSSFSDGAGLSVYSVWESQEDFEAFGEALMPILKEMGIDGEPMVMPVHRLIQ